MVAELHTHFPAQSIKPLLAHFGIDAPDISIEQLVLDSRDVAVHKGFVAVNGHLLDGRDFIPQAISLGAKVILSETDEQAAHGNIDMREQSLIIQYYQLSENLSSLASFFYAQPSEKLDLIAVTGTNGKTSTVQLVTQLRALVEGHAQPNAAASIGTLGAGFSGRLTDTINTTPDAISMQSMLASFKAEGAKQVALEASSHALVQHRIKQVKTDVAVFTNLSWDHLDYHGSMSAYGQAKRTILNQPGLRFAVINADDAECESWLNAMPATVEPVLYGLNKGPEVAGVQFCLADHIEYLPNGVRMHIDCSWGQADVSLSLLGHFNVANFLAALTSQLCLGIPLDRLVEYASRLSPVPGRMEVFHVNGKPSVVVDYAHTPDALSQVLSALRIHTSGKLICIFGCGGERDQGKRSLMGEIAERQADTVILTNDNSRSEDPQAIVDDILSGCRHPQSIQIQLDRKQAIAAALQQAQVQDLILVAGKGHEDYQIIGKQQLPYNERTFVKHYLEGNTQ